MKSRVLREFMAFGEFLKWVWAEFGDREREREIHEFRRMLAAEGN